MSIATRMKRTGRSASIAAQRRAEDTLRAIADERDVALFERDLAVREADMERARNVALCERMYHLRVERDAAQAALDKARRPWWRFW